MKELLGWVRDLEKTVAAIEAESKPRQQLLYTLEGLCTLIRDWAIAFRQKPDAVKKPSNRKPQKRTDVRNELWMSSDRKNLTPSERDIYNAQAIRGPKANPQATTNAFPRSTDREYADRERVDRHKGADDTTVPKTAEPPRRWIYNRSGSKQ